MVERFERIRTGDRPAEGLEITEVIGKAGDTTSITSR